MLLCVLCTLSLCVLLCFVLLCFVLLCFVLFSFAWCAVVVCAVVLSCYDSVVLLCVLLCCGGPCCDALYCFLFCISPNCFNSKKHSFSTLLTANLQNVHKYWQLRTVCTGQRLVMDAVALDDWCSSFEMSRSHSTSYCRGREIAESKDQHLMRLTFLCNVQ